MLIISKCMDLLRMKDPEEDTNTIYRPSKTSSIAPSKSSIYCPEAVYKPSIENVIDIYKPSTDEKDVSMKYVKPRNYGRNTHILSGRVVLSIICLLICLVATNEAETVEGVVLSWVCFGTLLIAADPLDIIARIAAPQTRTLICFSVFMFLLGIYVDDRYMIMALILSVMIIAAIYFKNKEWLYIHNFEMSDTVEKALRIDADNRAAKSWVYGGRKEAYTLLHEIGFSYGLKNLDGYARPLYSLGYWNGVKYGAKVEGLQADVKYWKSLAEELQDSMDEIGDIRESYEDRNEQLLHLVESQTDYIKQIEAQYKDLETAFNDTIEELEKQAAAAPADLPEVFKADDLDANRERTEKEPRKTGHIIRIVSDWKGQAAEQAAAERATVDSIIKEILDCNLSIDKAAAALNIKRWKVEHVRKAKKLLDAGQTAETVKASVNLTIEEIEEIKQYIA